MQTQTSPSASPVRTRFAPSARASRWQKGLIAAVKTSEPFAGPAVQSSGSSRYVCIQPGDYTGRNQRLYTSVGKLGFLVTLLLGGQAVEGDSTALTRSLRASNPGINRLCDVVKRSTSYQLRIVAGQGACDPELSSMDLQLLDSPVALKQFLFDDSRFIELRDGTSVPPWRIGTDHSDEFYFKSLVERAPRSYREVDLMPLHRWEHRGWRTMNGAILSPQSNQEFYAHIMDKGVIDFVEWDAFGPKDALAGADARSHLALQLMDSEGEQHGLKLSPELEVSYHHYRCPAEQATHKVVYTVRMPKDMVPLIENLPAPAGGVEHEEAALA